MAGVGYRRSALGGHRADKQRDIDLEPLLRFLDDGDPGRRRDCGEHLSGARGWEHR